MNWRASSILVVCAVSLAASAVLADDDDKAFDSKNSQWDKGFVQFGAFFTNLDSSFRLGAENIGIGLVLNVEKFLGLDETSTAFRFDGGYRFSKNRRHRIDFSWFSLNREGQNVLLEEVRLPNGTVIVPNTTIESIFDFDIYKVKYGYSFVLDDRIDLSIGGGSYVMPIKVGLGQAGETPTTEEITAPLPVLSLAVDVVVSPKWHLKQYIDFLYLELSGFQGTIRDINLAIERILSRRIGLGLGVESLDVEITSEDENNYPSLDFVGSIGFKYTGIQLYVRGRL